MAFQLPPLPYSKDSLSPFLSPETLDFHYEKHHNTYVTNLNNLIKDTPQEKLSLEELILTTQGPVFNNAAQVWNHTFYWNGLTPKSQGSPTGSLLSAIEKSFGSFEEFKKQFTQITVSQFGSGWGWLAQSKDGNLSVLSTSNAANPMTQGLTPLLTCDVWEHAYYIDFRNARARYVEQFWNFVNWDFVAQNLK